MLNKMPNKTYALDLSYNIKEAALYFDYVIPCYFHVPDLIPDDNIKLDSTLIPYEKIVPEPLFNKTARPQIHYDLLEVQMKGFQLIFNPDSPFQQDKERIFTYKVQTLVDKHKFLQEAAILLPPSSQSNMTRTPEDLLLTLSGLQLIDPEKVSWKQIIRFREDRKNVESLRRFRSFLLKDYKNKDRSFVEDDLSKRAEDYQQAVKDWGFETKTAVLSSLLSSDSILTLAGSALLPLLFGSSWTASLSVAGGVAIEIGKLSLELSKQKYVLQKLRREHPISYIIEVQKKIGTKHKRT